jgi:putative ABC transport system permease protein
MLHEIRLAFRVFRDHRAFVLAAVLTFGLGTGATAAVFSVVYGVLFRPLPYASPDRLVRVSEFHPGANAPFRGAWLSNLTYYAWRDDARAIGPIATYGSHAYTVGFEVPERLDAATVSPELFGVLQVTPAVGRFFVDEDANEGAAPVVVLSDGLWRSRFGADPNAIGRTMTLDGKAFTIVGVAPASLTFPTGDGRFWTVSGMQRPGSGDNVRISVSQAIARLRDGVTLEQASAEGTAVARRTPRPFVAEMMFGKGGPVEVRVRGVVDELTGTIRPALVVLAAAVAALLLITCANVANLFLSRGVAREREIAVRVALGASRTQLVRQLLGESLVVAAAGGIVGVAVAWSLLRLLPLAAPENVPRLSEVRLDALVLSFAVVMTLAAGVLSGLIPALRAARPDPLPSLREAVGASSGARTIRLRKALLAAEAAVAVVLLVGSMLLARSFVRLLHVDAGYDAGHVLTARIYLPGSGGGQADTVAFLGEFLPRVRALPGVVAAGAANMAPLGGSTSIAGFTLPRPGRDPVTARGLAYWGTPGYAEALRLRLRQGRLLRETDLTSPIQAMVVNEEFVRIFLSDVNPIGLQFPSILTRDATAEIVGVIGNVLKDGLDAAPQPEVYVGLSHKYSVRNEINLVLRSEGNPADLTASIRQAVRDVRSDAAIDAIATLDSQVSASVAQPRFAAAVVAGLAALAVLLSAIGLYSVLAYTVSRRTREIGVRTALGASRRNVVAMVCREGLAVAAIGLALGLGGAAIGTRFMQSLLFGVEPLDAISFVSAPAILLVVAAIACLLPARRAVATDPTVALKTE